MSNTLLVPSPAAFAIEPELSDTQSTTLDNSSVSRDRLGASAPSRFSIRVRGGYRMPTTSQAKTWLQVPAADVALMDNATNFIEVSAVTGLITVNTSGFTDGWSALYQVTVASGLVTAIEDERYK